MIVVPPRSFRIASPPSSRSFIAPLVCAALCLSLTGPASAEVEVRDLADFYLPAISIEAPGWTPDQQSLVYSVDLDFDGEREVHSVLAGGTSEPTVLASGAIGTPPGREFLFSADSQHVVFGALIDGERRLLSVPVAGGATVDLFGPRADFGAVLIDDSDWVYAVTDDAQGEGLFRAPVDGGAALRLTPPPPSPFGLDRGQLLLSPDGTKLAYFRGGGGAHQLLTVDVAGGTPTVVAESTFPVALGDAFFSGDSSHLVYRTDDGLFTTPVDQAAPVSFYTGQYLYEDGVSVGEDFFAYAWSNGTSGSYVEVAAVDGGTRTVVFDGQAMGLGVTEAPVRISASTSRVVFVANGNLRSVPIGGGSVIQLGTAIAATTGNSAERTYLLSDDGQRAIYRSPTGPDGRVELWSVPVAGGAAVRLSDPAQETEIERHSIQTAGDRVFFARGNRLFGNALTGGAEVALSEETVYRGFGPSAAPAPDGTLVAYRSAQRSSAAVELYVTPSAGGQAVRRSPEPRHVHGRVSHYRFADEGQAVVFRADRDTADAYELYSRQLVDDQLTTLNPPLAVDFQDSDDAEVTSDFEVRQGHAVFRLEGSVPIDAQSRTLFSQLFSSPLVAANDGPGGDATVLLSAADDLVDSFAVVGSDVIYLAGGELFRTGLTGGVPTRLDAFGGVIDSFEVTADGSTIIFASRVLGDFRGLWVMPSSGGSAMQLADTSSIPEDYGVSPDGQWARYDLSSTVGSVNIDGTDGAQWPGQSGVFTADSGHFLFSDSGVYSVAVGGTNAVDIAQPPGAAGVVTDWRLGPLDRVVFEFRDDPSPDPTRLFSVPAPGGDVTELSDPTLGAGPEGFTIAPDGETVIYGATPAAASQRRLYRVPAAGGPSVPLAAPDGAEALGFSSDATLFFFGDGDRLAAELLPVSGTLELTPGDFTGSPLDIVHSSAADAVVFRAEESTRRTGLFLAPLDSLLLIDDFESGDLSAWSASSP